MLPGGVFVNYRTDDAPLAAATIHAWLAQRFGNHRVFLDSVSLHAAEHYPTVIREALDNAGVLVAVVGPRWLTLAEPRSGVRLIDRPTDWVRTEIATALGRRIPIVPVLMSDSTADAPPPAPGALPPDIRPFATLQAFRLHRHSLRDDLELLAERILHLCPTLLGSAAAPAAHAADPFAALVEAFLAIPAVRDEQGRRTLLSLLDPAIATVVPRQSTDRSHVISLIHTSLQYPDGLSEVIRAVRELAGNTPAVEQLRQCAATFLSSMPGHL